MTPLEQFAKRFHDLGDKLSNALNLILPGPGKKVGFFLLVFRIDTPENPVTFLTDGATVTQTIALLKETIRRLEAEGKPGGHLQ